MGDLAGTCGEWWGGKVRVLQSVHRIDSFTPIELEKLGEQRDGGRALTIVLSVGFTMSLSGLDGMLEYSLLFEDLRKVSALKPKDLHPFATR